MRPLRKHLQVSSPYISINSKTNAADPCPAPCTQSYPLHFISYVQAMHGEPVSSPQVAQAFKDFYQSLYNIPAAQSPGFPSTLDEDKKSYVTETTLPTLDEDTISNLETPISEDEVAKSIAATPIDNSPGPNGFTPTFFFFFKSGREARDNTVKTFLTDLRSHS